MHESRASIVRHVQSASKLRKRIHQNRRKYEEDIQTLKNEIQASRNTKSSNHESKKEIANELMKQHRERLVEEARKYEEEIAQEKAKFQDFVSMDKEEKNIAYKFVMNKLDDFLKDHDA